MSTLDATFVPVKSCFHSRQLVRLVILLLLLQLLAPLPNLRLRHIQAAALPPTVAPPPTKTESAARVAEKLGQMPMTFEQNLGQTDDRVKFTARGQGYGLFLTPTEAVMTLQQAKNKRPLALRMQLVGGNPNPVVTGLEQTRTVSNYYLGHDPAKFRTGVPHFAKVKYDQVYPGIDAVYYGNQRELEYDFVIAPGVDPQVIQMRFKGARKLSLDNNGDLVIQTKGGELRHHKPVIYQDVNGTRQTVAGHFVLRGKQVSFAVGDYDRSKELVIDPTLNYSTYLGGFDGDEKGYAITLGGCSSGTCDAYVTGELATTQFYAPYAFPDSAITGGSAGGKDVFIAKLDADAEQPIGFFTFIGAGGDDWGTAITRNSSGDIYVAGILGTNNNTNYQPCSSCSFQDSDPFTASDDGFVLRLNSSGALQNFAYLGGSNVDKANGIALDGSGNVVVVGQTNSGTSGGGTAFPTAGSPYDSTHNGASDVFVSKLTSTLGTLSYSTFIGGSNNDYGMAVAVDSGVAYLTGYTQSTDYPVPGSPFDGAITGSAPVDAFVTKLDFSTGIGYSTYLGGNGRDYGYGIVVDSGAAFVTGQTLSSADTTWNTSPPSYSSSSTGFPITTSSAQTAKGSGGDAFVVKLNSSGTVVYSTYYGGDGDDTGYSIALDSNSKILITGETDSTDLSLNPASPSQFQGNQTGTDAFIVRIDPGGNGTNDLQFATYFGGGGTDSGRGIAASSTVAYLTGYSNSTSDQYGGAFKVAGYSGGSIYQDDVAGGFDSFITRITP